MTLRRIKPIEDGFTLIELLVVMILIGILSLTVANFIINWMQSSSLAQTRSTLLTTAENSLDTVTNDIMLSGYAEQNNAWPDTYGPSGPLTWASGSQVLVLAKAATDKNNNIIYSDSAKYITLKDDEIYFLTGTTLYRRTISSGTTGDAAVTTCPAAHATSTCPADKVIATGVSALTFAYYDANNDVVTPTSARSIQVSITLSQNAEQKTIKASYTTRMVFRNE